jgi:histidinol phosphatase-like enzyme (inositol monophosphatase family)
MSQPADLSRVRDVALDAARAGGRAALPFFRKPGEVSSLKIEIKSDESPVTQADREAEAACHAVIAKAFPDDGWIGEETGEVAGSSPRRWIIDPIDGTRNFIRGIPLWSTLVACEEFDARGARVIAGAVYLPGIDEIYDAALGRGARCNGASIRVSQTDRLHDSLFCYETPGWFKRFRLETLFNTLCDQTALQRGGGDAYYHMLVASGRAEIVIEPSLCVWDVAATSLIVSEAGGRFSDLAGNSDIRSGNAVITNGRLHADVLNLIKRS